MKPMAWLVLVMACCAVGSWGQDRAAVAAAQARQTELEEQYRRLYTTVEGILASQEVVQKRITTLAEELNRIRSEATRGEGNFVTRDELRRLAEQLQEVERKREADQKLVLSALEELRKVIKSGPAAGPVRRPPPEAETPVSSEAYEHEVQSGDALWRIINAYNERFKAAGKQSVTLEQVLKANPNLKPERLAVGSKIRIPIPPDLKK